MEELLNKYNKLNLKSIVNYERFNLISMSYHSTKIEGSTLSALETQVLLDNGLTPKGKDINDTYMVSDHFKALQYVIEKASTKEDISLELIQNINSLVMKNTGKLMKVALGTFNESDGVLRRWNVTAGINSKFPNYDKVEYLTNELVDILVSKMKGNLSTMQKLNLSFDAHYNLVAIHPFGDGNGRTSRLLMNYIQAYYGLPLAIVNSEDKQEYIQSIIDTTEKGNIQFFRDFMLGQYKKRLNEEISLYNQPSNINTKDKGGFHFLF